MTKHEMDLEFMKLDFLPFQYNNIMDYDEYLDYTHKIIRYQNKFCKEVIIAIDFENKQVAPYFYIKGSMIYQSITEEILRLIIRMFDLYDDNQLDIITSNFWYNGELE